MNDDMIFLSNSIDNKDEDIIGFETYVEKLDSAIEKEAQMIAITSPFGSGKTSIIELLKEKRKSKKREKILKISMWSELNHLESNNKYCELHKNFLYQIGSAISSSKGTYINRRLSNNYGLLKLHVNKTRYWLFLLCSICCFVCGWFMKQYKDVVIKLTPLTDQKIGYISPFLILLALILFLIIISRTEVIFSSKKSEKNRVIEADEIIDLYRNEILTNKCRFKIWLYKLLKKIPLIKAIPFLTPKKFIVIIEDLDRTDNGEAVIHFLKELRKYYIHSAQKTSTLWNKVVFVVNIKPEATVMQEIANQNPVPGTGAITEELYSKLFDFILELQTINFVDFETVLNGLLKDKQLYLEEYDLKSPSEKLSDIPGMKWIIQGSKIDIRKTKNRLNKAFTIYETLRKRFPEKKDGINFQKCAVSAYLTTEYELEFSETEDKAFEILIELFLRKNLDEETVKAKLSTENVNYVREVYNLIKARHIGNDYRLYFYNYPRDSVIYNNDETNIQNAILHGIVCKQFDVVAQRVVASGSDVVKKSLEQIRQLELPLPQVVIKNESLFLAALKYEYAYVLNMFDKIQDTDAALNKNISTIIDILKYDLERQIYNPEIISEFCGRWEGVFDENHLVHLRETICEFFANEIQLYKKLFYGEHSAITTKEMSLLSFLDALELLNVESKNFSVSHVKYIINRFIEEKQKSEMISDRICKVLIYACGVFSGKEIIEYIIDYMKISGKIVEELDETVWNLLDEEAIESENEDEETGLTYKKQNEIFQKYKELINSIPVSNITDAVLEHINMIDYLEKPYEYSIDLSNLLFERGYQFMSVLVKIHNGDSIDFSNKDIVESIKHNCAWSANHKEVFLRLREQIILNADNIFDYKFCFTSNFPLLSRGEFSLLIDRKNISLKEILEFFPPEIINEEAVEYISKHFNKEHVNNYDAFDVLEELAQYRQDTVKLFFEKIDFAHAFLYYTFAEWRKKQIKNIFWEKLELDTCEGKLKFMEYTKYVDEKFERELVGNTDEDQESRYIKLINRKLGPRSVSSTTIQMLKSFNMYYAFNMYSNINEKLFEDEEYEYYVVSKTLSSKKFVMETGDRLEKIWPTYIEIFSNPSRLSQTVSYMRMNVEFLQKIIKSHIYKGFSESALEQLAFVKQDFELVKHVYERGSEFAIKYFSSIKEGFVDYTAAKKYVELLSEESNLPVLRSDVAYENIYDKLVDPGLKRRYTNLRKAYVYKK